MATADRAFLFRSISTVRPHKGFSLLEILMAVTIVGFCFVPILGHAQATIRETEHSQESILARHLLMDMIERFKGSDMAELSQLPTSEPAVSLGQEPAYLKNDSMLSDNYRIAKELQAKSLTTGSPDSGLQGHVQFVDVSGLMNVTRVAWFVPNGKGTGNHVLNCAVRWKSRNGGGEKRLDLSRILQNVP